MTWQSGLINIPVQNGRTKQRCDHARRDDEPFVHW